MDHHIVCARSHILHTLSASYVDRRVIAVEKQGRKIKTRYMVAIAVAVAALFYYLFDPLESQFMPQCMFHKLTGLQCIGCGSQRMIHALLHGDIAGAIRANGLLFFSIPFLIFLIWVETQRTRRPRLYSKVYSVYLIVAVGVVASAWLFLRNIFGI